MCGESMNMMKVCGKIPSKARLGKNWDTSVNEKAIYCLSGPVTAKLTHPDQI